MVATPDGHVVGLDMDSSVIIALGAADLRIAQGQHLVDRIVAYSAVAENVGVVVARDGHIPDSDVIVTCLGQIDVRAGLGQILGSGRQSRIG